MKIDPELAEQLIKALTARAEAYKKSIELDKEISRLSVEIERLEREYRHD